MLQRILNPAALPSAAGGVLRTSGECFQFLIKKTSRGGLFEIVSVTRISWKFLVTYSHNFCVVASLKQAIEHVEPCMEHRVGSANVPFRLHDSRGSRSWKQDADVL